MTRAIVIWLPDWPVTAYLRTVSRDAARRAARDPATEALPVPDAAGPPIAIMHANRVVACSASARAEGVRRGQRRRDAQAACPSLRVAAADPGRDERSFLPVLTRLDELAPGVQPLRPGLSAVRARGPARFYGGEEEAALALLDALTALGLPRSRAGVADGVFTAERAARLTSADAPVRIVPPGASAAFLSPLSIASIEDETLVGLLPGLGVQTLGAFAALDAEQVRARLGEQGARLHALARGADSRPIEPRIPPPELARDLALEPPLDLADQIAFAVRQTCDDVCTALGERSLVCTEVRITLTDDRGARSDRVWLHPTRFDAASLVDRVRWQLQAAAEQSDGLVGAISHVRIDPETVDDSAHHRPALIGHGPDERLHHAMSRVQAMLGHRGVVVPAIGGGRWLEERETRVPWGDGERPAQQRDAPWPGSLPQPLPSEVFRSPRGAHVTADGGTEIAVDDRGMLTAPPAVIDGRRITAWAGPWPVIERGWDGERMRRAHRFQVIDAEQTAWLLVLEDGRWRIEGRYA
ncbi:DNA polymerase Y family protein [Microbacterium betulae]|uniref:DNA polymerase Y family protein n=1 Tax=Microbacterium betulae TaxID=2981139 RepID=A0AA97I4J0_9MICO|nr:DNA polymerase Y family protein [Microbacterium sp. AB]WOF21809.1 DNA polymerase Y family protein [Microbacterium sp. AB]